ncbi:hypothetical protein MNBD_GAMMA12-1617 [hydrothermal vent metagenome]|uniref:T6SS immunity protein Tdi1 C-terminal domain-containing protein n=1 Tax=hydrothermal vent metagenome TaxID=652676 RepID=A0A3B0Z2M3_9ZZZZ
MNQTKNSDRAYTLIDPVSVAKLTVWEKYLKPYDKVVGYSNLGYIFLWNSDNNEYVVLNPFMATTECYGIFASIKEFEHTVLEETDFIVEVLQASPHLELIEKAGPLENEEVYVPQPIPLIGDTKDPKTYIRADVWMFMDVIGDVQITDYNLEKMVSETEEKAAKETSIENS